MRYLILSDIHGNLEALDAVLAHAAAQEFDNVLVLGDLVGYGADPNAVVDAIRALDPFSVIRGNHDKVAARLEGAEAFNIAARKAISWTTQTLTAKNLDYLAALEEGPLLVDDQVEICHGAPSDEDEYLFEVRDAVRALRDAKRPICFFGHTHVQIVYQLSDEGELDVSGSDASSARRLSLLGSHKYLINPGSIGQPRDGDPRAAYGLLDSEIQELKLFRVSYAVDRAQAKIRQAGLPEVLASRLAVGR
ncbi:MAG TPA: metallophosphoesterase family protein [Vicinamibacterales bacterium]|jgi:predicted phosphodiesterase